MVALKGEQGTRYVGSLPISFGFMLAGSTPLPEQYTRQCYCIHEKEAPILRDNHSERWHTFIRYVLSKKSIMVLKIIYKSRIESIS